MDNVSNHSDNSTNVEFNEIISISFYNTFSSFVLTSFIVIFGSIKLYNYVRYATPIEQSERISSKLFHLQLFTLTLVPSLNVLSETQTILSSSLMCFSFMFSIGLVAIEIRYSLPSAHSKRHSLVLIGFWSLVFVNENILMIILKREQSLVFLFRYACCIVVLVLGFVAPGIIPNPEDDESSDEESGLKKIYSTWIEDFRDLKLLVEFLWPKRNAIILIYAVLCIFIIVLELLINVLVPIYNKKIVDNLGNKQFCWDLIMIHIGFKFLKSGFFRYSQNFFWIRIREYIEREVKVGVFAHLHSLSLRWHLSRNIGGVLNVFKSCGYQITGLIFYIAFEFFPTIADIMATIIFLMTSFTLYFTVIAIATMAIYLWLTILITEWGEQLQKEEILNDNEQESRSVDSLLNYETVKYFCAEKYEVDAYRNSMVSCQKQGRKYEVAHISLDAVQNTIVYGSLLIGSLICGYLVANESTMTIGHYVLFGSYINQLFDPMYKITYNYGVIRSLFVEMEYIIDLLETEPEVVDSPDAIALPLVRGDIEFSDVTFGYSPERMVLKNVSFSVPRGKTVALVGPSGSGKSTVIRLLFRFYDVSDGSICVDGHNIKTVQLESLRRAIGVVPQDTVLFNETIKYNIKYGRLDATDDEVIEATEAADLHEKIMNFTDQYETKVGERGLKLSGGEKQRVAIARTILKNPPIMLLDEATSSLDTQTERNIQSALSQLCKNRTTIIVAHRLSTIVHADEILVLKDGEIVERGQHKTLLHQNGIYADMWNKQLQDDNEEEDEDADENAEKDSDGDASSS